MRGSKLENLIQISEVEGLKFKMLWLLCNQKTNRKNNHDPCLHCLQQSPNKRNLEDFMMRIVAFSDSIFKGNWFSVSFGSN